MNKIQSKSSNNAYREGWERIFIAKADWTAGRPIGTINAIRKAAKVFNKSPEEIATSVDTSLWKPFLYSVN
jgi:hypothetical protein